MFGLGGEMGSFGILVSGAEERGPGARQQALLFGGDGHGIRSDLRDSTGRESSLKLVGAK